MEKQTVVVYDKETKEILACIPLSGKDCICRKDIDFKIYNQTEPIFTETENGIVLNKNAFIMKLDSL